MTTVVISQPQLFPWTGFYELAAQADVFVHLDDVQFPDRSFTNRVQIKTPAGTTWMTIPIRDRTARRLINETAAMDGPWRKQHRELVRHALAQAPFLDEALAILDRAHAESHLTPLIVESFEGPARHLGLLRGADIVYSSALDVETRSSQRILDLVLRVGGTRYVTAHGAANYLDHEAFERAGVAVAYAEYSRTPYAQQHGAFTPYVSILDAIANLGREAARLIVPAAVPWRDFMERRRAAESA